MNNSIVMEEKEQTGSALKMLLMALPSGAAMIKAVLMHPVEAYRIMQKSQEALKRGKHFWQREETELQYEIPQYTSDMKSCTSKEKYLRPTRLIESDAPEIIAMANKLGSYQKPDKEYVDECFKFVRRRVRFAFNSPIKGALKTLKSGEAVCYDMAHLFIALCRAGGIPARLKTVNAAFTEQIYTEFTREFPIVKDLYDSVGYFTMHTMAEAFVDGKWQVGDVSIDDTYQAALGLPISRFGDDSSAKWSWEEPGKTLRYEAIPPMFATFANIGMKQMKGVVMMIQDSWVEGLAMGQKAIEEAGGLDEYDRKIRQTYKAKLPEVSKKLFNMLYEEELIDAQKQTAAEVKGAGSALDIKKGAGVAAGGS